MPSQIGQYTVIRELGHGGMGVVYLAEQASLKRLVALKVIRHGINATPEEVAPFPCRGGGGRPPAAPQHRADPRGRRLRTACYYLALEYVEGGSLDQRLAARRRTRGRRPG